MSEVTTYSIKSHDDWRIDFVSDDIHALCMLRLFVSEDCVAGQLLALLASQKWAAFLWLKLALLLPHLLIVQIRTSIAHVVGYAAFGWLGCVYCVLDVSLITIGDNPFRMCSFCSVCRNTCAFCCTRKWTGILQRNRFSLSQEEYPDMPAVLWSALML